MNISQRIKAFSELGRILQEKSEIFKTTNSNTWFTQENTRFAISQISGYLNYKNLNKWTDAYPELQAEKKAQRIGVILAGNIPLVGFHDFLCVLISGNIFVGKLSSKDDKFPLLIADLLIEAEPRFEKFIRFENDRLSDFDAIIATGSNNSARYFEYYFGKYPNIIRKNRNSVAVLTGNETDKELELLSDDILMYFGLGCRNVSKLFLPKGYKLDNVFKNTLKYKDIINHNKYSNNYGYNRAIFLMNNVVFYDNNFMLITENQAYASPVSVVHFEYYDNISELKKELKINIENIQCLVSQKGLFENSVYFGESQKPTLSDYADNIDTMKWLTSLNSNI